MLTPDQLDTPMDFETLKKAGSGLGSAGVIVVDDRTCMVATALKYGNFFKVESCGQCPPCRMGTINLAALLQKIEDGEGTEKDLASLLQLCGFVKGRGYCTVVTGASVVVESSLRLFRREFEDHIAQKRCPFQEAAVAGGVA
jgi:NADH-quinone oxidoreductase subunit F